MFFTAISLLPQIHWSRLRSLLNPNKTLDERLSLSFPGRRSQAVVPGLEPFSEYRLAVSVYNKKGNGPNSDPVTFSTPEGGQSGSPRLPFSKCYVVLTADTGDRVRTPAQSQSQIQEWNTGNQTGTEKLWTQGVKHGQGDRLTQRNIWIIWQRLEVHRFHTLGLGSTVVTYDIITQ